MPKETPTGAQVKQKLIVLQSFPAPRPTTNPYLVMLFQSMSDLPDLEIRVFDWRGALFKRYDVFHVHWPENLIAGRTGPRRFLHQSLFAILLIRLRVLGVPIVRTVHNVDLPSGLSRVQVWLLAWTARQTTLRIRLNSTTAIPADQPYETIVLGDYAAWFEQYALPETQPGRILFFGLIRRYKGVEDLIKAFRETTDDSRKLQLRIVGNPSTAELSAELSQLAQGDERITMDLRFLSDAELVAEIGAAQLIVLPYKEMHNSASVMTALSLSRPVLVPDNVVNRVLRAEVGFDWVSTYPDEISSAAVLGALDALGTHEESGPPDLSARTWSATGTKHEAAYRRAVMLLKGSRGRTARAIGNIRKALRG